MDPAVALSVVAVFGLPVSIFSAVLAWRAVEASRDSALASRQSAGASQTSADIAREQLRIATAPRFRASLERVPGLSCFGQRLWLTLDGPDPVESAVVQIVGGSSLPPGQGGRELGMEFDPQTDTRTLGPLQIGEPVVLTAYAGENVPAGVRLRVTTVHAGRPAVALVAVDVPRFEPDDFRVAYER